MTHPLPVTKNQQYIIEITDFGIKGEGIGKRGQFTLYVPGTVPGDVAEVRVIKLKKTYGYGRCVSLVTRSPLRVMPPCPVANACGGCQIQQFDYPAQLVFKHRTISNNLARIGHFTECDIWDVLGMETPFRYRNKAQFAISVAGDGLEVGLYKLNSHHVVDIDECLIQHPLVDDILPLIKTFILKSGLSVYNEVLHTGILRHVMMRFSFDQDIAMVTLVINQTSLPSESLALLVSILTAHPKIKSVYLNFNTQKGDTILGETCRHVWGLEAITEKIGAHSFQISPLSFFQVNPIQTKVLYDEIVTAVSRFTDPIVWDLYCGAGSIGIYVSSYAKSVLGIESNADAVADAGRNIELNQCANMTIYHGLAEDLLGTASHPILTSTPTVVIIDPPRKGCEASVLSVILSVTPEMIVYVSCNPSTLARDLRILCDGGYEIEHIQPIDMFPHTVHIESVTVLRRAVF